MAELTKLRDSNEDHILVRLYLGLPILFPYTSYRKLILKEKTVCYLHLIIIITDTYSRETMGWVLLENLMTINTLGA